MILCVIVGCVSSEREPSGPGNRGVKLYESYQYDAATAHFRQACDPTVAARDLAAVDAADVALRAGDREGASRALQKQVHVVDLALNSVRLGSSAIAAGDYDAATKAFRDATRIMNRFHMNTELQKFWGRIIDETQLVYKGEPYERAMAHYYLGILYYMRGDYGNAGACLRNSLFKLKIYDEQNDLEKEDSAESEFALGWYLLARCRQRMNDPENTKRCYQYAAQPLGPANRWVADQEVNADSNVLLVIESGKGPYKTVYGPNAVLADLNPMFVSRPLAPQVWVDGKKVRQPAHLINMRHIAAKKKWQNIDTIRYVKGFLSSGLAVEALRRGDQGSPVLRGLAKALSLGTSYDIRHWEMMPDSVYVLPLELPPGKHTLKIIYRDTRGAPCPWHQQEWDEVDVPAKRERLLWVRCGPEIKGGKL